jgi:hypothetical protein
VINDLRTPTAAPATPAPVEPVASVLADDTRPS